jgi:hypothetical protein
VVLDALDRLICALMEGPEGEWHAWAKRLAAAVSDGGVQIPIRMPLFRRVLLPALAAGVLRAEPGCARWLAWHEPLLGQSDLSLLPESMRAAEGLLREALRVDASDATARRRLVEKEAWYFEYTLHELPAGVLYGHDAATSEECDKLTRRLDEFCGHVRVLDAEARYGELIRECRYHYRAYADYLRAGRAKESYAAFLARRRRGDDAGEAR